MFPPLPSAFALGATVDKSAGKLGSSRRFTEATRKQVGVGLDGLDDLAAHGREALEKCFRRLEPVVTPVRAVPVKQRQTVSRCCAFGGAVGKAVDEKQGVPAVSGTLIAASTFSIDRSSPVNAG